MPVGFLPGTDRSSAAIRRFELRPISEMSSSIHAYWRPKKKKKLYVGNLSYEVSDSDLEQLFSPHGTVESAQVIMDRDTNRSKGFGFVEMGSDSEAQAAISALDGQDQGGRALKVNEAKPREPRGGGGGGGRDRY